VTATRDGYTVPAPTPSPSTPPLWALPIALLLATIAGQIGRRIGLNASMDLETAARRMAVVGAKDIRSVTMSIARPRSVPEVREMALALDTLAATLLRMAEDQKRAVSVRTEAARVRSFVLASVSHDLRGPLNSVLGFAELLLSGAEGPLTDGQRESLEALVRGARDLLRLVGDLLDHARLDAERMTIERAPVSMDLVIDKARLAAVDRAKNPTSVDDIPIEGEAGLRVVADEERLAQAIGALTAFALLRPGSDGRVVLRLHREGERVAVSIRGGGSTPARDALARMFEPFDFAPTGARAPAGLNLAVSVARGVVRLHGGTVAAEPHDEGGIALTIALPSARVTGEFPAPDASGPLRQPTPPRN
jgi:K+-sensing histidine kinase KdpD